MTPTNGHEQSRYFQFQKTLVKQFAEDYNIKLSETSSTLILENNDSKIEIKPKNKEYTDLNTKTTSSYHNERACLMGLFRCY